MNITTRNLMRCAFLIIGFVLLIALTACSGENKEATAVPSTVIPATNEPEPTAVPTTQPTATAKPEATATAAVPEKAAIPDLVVFSRDEANSALPGDLYQQVNYFGMLDAAFAGISCIDMVYEGIEIDMEYNLGAYSALSDSTDSPPTLYDSIEIRSCEWQAGDEISVRLTLPSGETIVKEIVYGEADPLPPRAERVNELVYADDEFDEGELALYFVPGFDSEPGEYLLTIEGNGRSLSYPFTVAAPNQPRVFDERNEDNPAWLLSQFSPGEQVRFVVYGNSDCNWDEMYKVDPGYVSLCFMGLQTYTVPDNGRLTIQTKPTDNFLYYAIVGEQSGTFALNSIINAEVAQSDAQVRAGWVPRFYASNLDIAASSRLAPGASLRIIGSQAGRRWVRLPDGNEGWVISEAVEKVDTAVASSPNPIYTADGSDLPEWVYLPQSAFFYMGSGNYNAEYTEDAEQPEHSVTLSPFWIQRAETSNAAYSDCVAAGACTPPTSSASATRSSYYGNPDFADYPVIFVTQPQAQDYCAWAGGRLPTEAEWEYAARYGSSSYYVWGDNAATGVENPNLANFDDVVGDTTAVTAYFDGATDAGLVNLHGNVWEWTADWYDPGYYTISPEENPTGPANGSEKVARGGSWSTGIEYISLTNRYNRNPNQGYDNVGFRCARITNPEP